jgi:hypothetical protein
MLPAVKGDARLRLAGLLAAGSLAVHQLRYAAGYGSESSRALADQGHGYLGPAGAVIALLLAVALGVFVGALLRGRHSAGRHARFRSLWLVATASLSAIYVGQELIEGALADGHPEGLAGVVAHGGWLAFAVAAAVGALVALAMRGADAALAAARAGRALSLARPAAPPVLLPLPQLRRPAAPCAASPPARGPPAVSC